MYLAYSLLLTLGLLVLIPHFIYQAIAHGKYVDGLRQRLGSLEDIHESSRPVIWLHCVSVGETQAARPLVKKIRTVFPHHALVVSTITATGQKLAQQVFAGDVESIFYFPFDWRWTVRRALNAVNPDVVLIMETELWPNFLSECYSRSIPVALVNGRISRQSFRRYRLVRFFLKTILSHLNMAVMQSESDAERIASLGLDPTKLFTAGNLKFDVGSVATSAEATQALQQRFGLSQNDCLILAASTHSPEEKIVIDAFQQLRQKHKVRLMIAPRRPERFNEVARLLDDSGLRCVRRTSPQQATDSNAEVILLDTIGELPAVYTLATVVFVGGSIVDRGGHNVLEPASKGACVVTGYHTDNFQAIVQLLNEADAIVQLPPVDPAKATKYLERELKSLLIDQERRIRLGHEAKTIVENNQGAADRTVEIIKPLFTGFGEEHLREEVLLVTKSQA
jgi:3-deoxy-D-manno-octulosonic-acid transferase